MTEAFRQGFVDMMRKMAAEAAPVAGAAGGPSEVQSARKPLTAYDFGRAAMAWPTITANPPHYTGAASNLVDRIGQHIMTTRPDFSVSRATYSDGSGDYMKLVDEHGTSPMGVPVPQDVVDELKIPERNDDGTRLSNGQTVRRIQRALASRIDQLVPGTGGNTGFPARYISVPNPLHSAAPAAPKTTETDPATDTE